MHSPIVALIWEIWRQNRRWVGLVISLVAFGWVFNSIFGDSLSASKDGREDLMTLNVLLTVGALFLVFGVFNYTEFNPQKEWTGFPYRLFALPVSTWMLVTVPMVLGVAMVELTFLGLLKLVFTHGEWLRPEWFGVLVGAYMVFYQAILWSFAAFRILRMIILGIAGTSFIGVAMLPFLSVLVPVWWLSEKVLAAALISMALLAFGIAWSVVARQRTGGGRRQSWLKALAELILDQLPRRRRTFRSAAAAQFWFEWRRSGLLLPAALAAMLVLVIVPLSWHLREEALTAPWILTWTLAMPVLLAAAIGKGFSKPDFWTSDLSLPTFVAVRPMSSGDLIVTKMRVAAVSAGVSWTLVLSFLCVWLPLWANLDSLTGFRIGIWMVYDHSLIPQYVIAALSIFAGVLLTWKFLVGGLWVGLSGSRQLFAGSAAAYALVAILGVAGLNISLLNDESFRGWVRNDPSKLLSYFEWIAAVAVIGKFWLAAFSWRRIGRARVVKYLLLWSAATLLLLALARLDWMNGALSLALSSWFDLFPLDVIRLKYFLILLALLVVPFGRVGLAPSSLAKNRHRGVIRSQG